MSEPELRAAIITHLGHALLCIEELLEMEVASYDDGLDHEVIAAVLINANERKGVSHE